MLRLAATVTLVMSALFSTSVLGLSHEWERPQEMDPTWQVMFTSHVHQVGQVGYIMNLDRSDIQPLRWQGQQITAPACSPDGRFLAFIVEPSLYIMAADGQTMRAVYDSARSLSARVGVSNDGSVVVYSGTLANGQRGTMVIHTQTAQVYDLSYEVVSSVAIFDLSPDGRRVIFQSKTNDLFLASTDGSTLRPLVGQATHPAWSPDGSLMAYAALWNGDYNISLLDVYRAIPVRLTRQRDGFANNLIPAWSPDSRRITYSRIPSTNNYGGDIYVIDADGGTPRPLTNPPTTVLGSCLLAGRPDALVG